MAPKDKSRAAGVSASSFLDLQAELERKKQEFAKNKAAGKAMAVVGGTKRPDKVRPYRVHHECQQDHAHI